MKWQEIPFGTNEIEIIDGDRSSNYPKDNDFIDEGIPFLSTPNIVENRFNFNQIRFISAGKFETLRKGKLKFGDLVLTTRGSIGNIAFWTDTFETGFINAQMLILRADNENVSNKFLYYSIVSPKTQELLKNIASGTAQPQLPMRDLKSVKLKFPPIETQKRIAEILSAYDDLIENNLKRIRLLEESARLLYREWFVRLKFPNHEHTPIIDGLPKGWEKLSVPEFIDVNPRTPIDKEKEKCFVEMANLATDSMVVDASQVRTGNSGSKFQNGDTLFARITPCLENGKTGFVNFLEEDEVGFGSTEFIVLRPKTVSPEFVYCLSRTYHFRENAIKNMVGSSGRQRVKTSCFDEFFVAIPPKKILDEFKSITKPCFRQIRNLQLQNQKLKKARDLLLPRLMSGEIAV